MSEPKREPRPIAPSDSSQRPSNPFAGSVVHEPHDPRATKLKRSVVHVACLACRRLRIKCDGQRPACVSCARRGEACEYDVEANTTRTNALKRRNETLKNEVEQYKELYRCIRMQPEYDAAEVFRRIRATENPLDVLSQLKAANMLVDSADSGMSSVPMDPSQDPDESLDDEHTGSRASEPESEDN